MSESGTTNKLSEPFVTGSQGQAAGGMAGGGSEVPGLVPNALRTYAEFGRDRGGLLYVLQALIGLVQRLLVVGLLIPQAWWSPAGLLPLYLAYFAVRDRLWRRLYGTAGRVEAEKSLREARFGLWWSLGIGALCGVTWFRSGARPVGWPVAVVWLVAFWLPLAVRGRLPIDGAHFLLHYVTAFALLYQRWSDLLVVSRLLGLALIPLALYGLYEHHKFGHVLEGWPRK